MKLKIVLTLAISACLIMGMSIYVFAGSIALDSGASTTLQSPQGTNTGINITPSSKVNLYISTNSGTLYDASGTSYAIGACHTQGDKVFGGASGTSSVYFKGIEVRTCTSSSVANPGGNDSSAFASGWYSM